MPGGTGWPADDAPYAYACVVLCPGEPVQLRASRLSTSQEILVTSPVRVVAGDTALVVDGVAVRPGRQVRASVASKTRTRRIAQQDLRVRAGMEVVAEQAFTHRDRPVHVPDLTWDIGVATLAQAFFGSPVKLAGCSVVARTTFVITVWWVSMHLPGCAQRYVRRLDSLTWHFCGRRGIPDRGAAPGLRDAVEEQR